jgi:CBS domain-containing protein
MRTLVEDVMTTDVAAVHVGTPFRVVAELLLARHVSAVPVVDSDNRVVGVVSEADLLHKEEYKQLHYGDSYRPQRAGLHFGIAKRDTGRDAKAAATTAWELMTSPALTVPADAPVVVAARRMERHGVKRLPVVDDRGHLVGIVSRCDLLRVFLRRDSDIEHTVRQDAIAPLTAGDAEAVRVSVRDGVVELSGRLRGPSQAKAAAWLTENVDGVVDVVDHLTWPKASA